MTQQPKVSVLISFYNLAPFVDQTMESVLAQKTDFPVEILCADDGSDDGTIEKLRGWEAAHPDTVRVFVMDRVPGKKYEGNERIRRMNAIRGRLFYEAKGSYVCYLDGDDFYTDDRKLQKQADILDADTGHKYVACGHNGCYYWQSTGETKPIEKPIRECALTAKEYWSFFYIHTNAMMFRNIGLQGIDPYTSGIQIIDNLLTYHVSALRRDVLSPGLHVQLPPDGGQHLPPPQRLPELYPERLDALPAKDGAARFIRRGAGTHPV